MLLLGIRIITTSSVECCPGGVNCKIRILCNSVTNHTVFCSVFMNNKWKAFAAIARSKDKHTMDGGLTNVGLSLIPLPHR